MTTMSKEPPAQEKLWGAPLIARVINVSQDYVYTLAKRDGVPIYQPTGTGKVFAFRSELLTWLRTKPKKT